MSDMAVLLRDLHTIHQQLSDLRDRLARGPKQIKAREANVARCEAELETVKAEQKAVRVAADQKQLALKTSESKILDLQTKLNQANSNREYQAFKDQIAADQMAGSVLADEILEAFEKIDQIAAKVTEAQQNVAKAKDEMAKTQQQINTQQAGLESEVTRLEGDLKTREEGLPADFRDVYQRMVKSKGSDALAAVEGEDCGGCYQKLTPNVFNSLILGKVVFCLSCGRVLYLPEGHASAKVR